MRTEMRERTKNRSAGRRKVTVGVAGERSGRNQAVRRAWANGAPGVANRYGGRGRNGGGQSSLASSDQLILPDDCSTQRTSRASPRVRTHCMNSSLFSCSRSYLSIRTQIVRRDLQGHAKFRLLPHLLRQEIRLLNQRVRLQYVRL